MPENEKKEREAPKSAEEKDDFWDVDMLLPKTRVAPRRAPGATDTAEIVFELPKGGDVPTTEDEDFFSVSFVYKPAPVEDSPLNLNPKEGEVVVRHSIPPHTAADPELLSMLEIPPEVSYENENGLIHRVAVYPWSRRYHYYRDFCADAARYLSYEPEGDFDPVKSVPFFSYVPQYSQLSREQLDFYFLWRREFRRGNTPPVDDSYLYLYIYELLNTAGHETAPEEGLLCLYRLFFTYGEKNARLSRLLSEWIVDYSLIFHLSVPESVQSDRAFRRTYNATLKEFYISAKGSGSAGYAELLIRFCSAYDYRKSHFYKGNNCAYFDRYLPGALSAVIAQYSIGDRLFSKTGMKDSHMTRNAFEQALCSYRIRYRIEVDYASFSRAHELRFLVSDILKYTENRLRGFLGLKSRLTVYSLSLEMKKCIDRYCDEHFPRKSETVGTRKREETPTYEKLYDLPETPLSVEHAAEIELSSWETTRRLTEAFSDGEDGGEESHVTLQPVEAPTAIEEPITAMNATVAVTHHGDDMEKNDLEALFGALYPFAYAAYREDFSEEHAVSLRLGKLPELIADEINERAADEFGDILLEETEGGYVVLSEYRSLFEA